MGRLLLLFFGGGAALPLQKLLKLLDADFGDWALQCQFVDTRRCFSLRTNR